MGGLLMLLLLLCLFVCFKDKGISAKDLLFLIIKANYAG